MNKSTEFKFGAISISEIGSFISKKLMDDNVNGVAELNIELNGDEFKRVDEDLYYRMRENEDEKFEPSEGEIIINFDKVKITITQKSEIEYDER